MSFELKFKTALEDMIPKEHDDYVEIRYTDTLYVHVWSDDNGEGSFEISVVVPYDHNDGYDVDAGTLSMIPGTEELYQTLKRLTEEVTGKEYPNFAFYLTQQVDDGSWERHANVYETHELEA